MWCVRRLKWIRLLVSIRRRRRVRRTILLRLLNKTEHCTASLWTEPWVSYGRHESECKAGNCPMADSESMVESGDVVA